MKALNRRDFLRGAFLRAHAAEAAAACGSDPQPASCRATGKRLPIGRIADFPVGETRRLSEAGLEVESLPEGLRARSLAQPAAYHRITAGPTGELIACLGEAWPGDWVYSAMINGPTGLETGTEEDR